MTVPVTVPDYITPFTAYRVWDWDVEGLKSLNGALWRPGVAMEAVCNTYGGIRAPVVSGWADRSIPMEQIREHLRLFHQAPVIDCRCGIYAAKHWRHLIDIDLADSGIHGEISLWGRIEECDLGYRAQYAYPRFFIIPPRMLTFDMKDVQQRLDALIAFNVDIYVSKQNEPKPKVEKIPLWMTGYGYSQQGTSFITECIQRFYSFHEHEGMLRPEVDDRLAIAFHGISIIKEVTDTEVTAVLFNQDLYRIPLKYVGWSRRNNRWECEATKVYISGGGHYYTASRT